MEERLILRFNCEQIEKILFEYYFGDNKNKEQISKTLKMDYKIINRKLICTTITDITFILSYEEQVGTITRQFIIELQDLNKIINEKFASQGFEIDYMEENIDHRLDSQQKKKLNGLKYNLKRKEEVKVKKKGCK